MALLILSLIVATIGGCALWLAIGDRLPPGGARKWETWQNIAIYALAIFVPVYLAIFFNF